MKKFLHLLNWDLRLLYRNNLIVLSMVVAGLYVGLFYLLKPLGDLTNVLVILLFNDPVVTGFLFAGVLLLFDKNQNTLQAVRVLPVPFPWYLLSKAALLSALAVLTGLIMAVAAVGWDFHWVPLTLGVTGSAVFFAFSGFYLAAFSRSFNHFLMYTIGFLVVMAVPMVELFGLGRPAFFLAFPSFAGLKLIMAAFRPMPVWQQTYAYLYLAISILAAWQLLMGVVRKQVI